MINSVILFIRDTLPIFLLVSLLLSQSGMRLLPLGLGILVGLLFACGWYVNLSSLSTIADGAGLELIKVTLLLFELMMVCFFARDVVAQHRRANLWAVLLVVAITSANAIHFFIYSVAYWSNEQTDMSLIMGSVIGLGISLSLSILLHAMVNSIRYPLPKLIVLCVFCAGQFAGIVTLLEQIDYLNVSTRLWNSSTWVADGSEYGHLLNVLFGYEATPSSAYMFAYLTAVFLPILSAFVLRKDMGIEKYEAPSL
ncbi:MAG: hypothetical protein CL600_07430 [Alteromonas sp.]|uniref:hypothetical protein n=1 Tax=Alteromonas sp. RW2A1 TaxID=1917158 RepID=UPI000903632F|nr:hypothetical protein [Alteromonas sp. RW2A1]APE06308.1 hypothetical protein BM528_11445 [Alteromonas sp. RW2A1]MAI64688.1 hypothetical protein [Alteromonas sp.]